MQISSGKKVCFHYAILNDKGEVVETSREQEPLEFSVGENQLIAGLENAMLGKSAGDKFQVKLKPEQAYGSWDEDKVYDVAKDMFGQIEDLKVGLVCQLTNEKGDMELVSIVEINDEVVTVDSNHPYAGEDVKFSVEITDVKQ